ncbi:MAG: leucine-rich repeat domain-containing protein, partial [Bacteroidales bacterium]|nr:leucine-rich repeat domain-containing protein [Bacteroidales bacterium]
TKTLKYSFTDKTVPGSIFEKCPALCGVRVSNTVTGIGGYAFSKTSIRHFELPATVISYGSGVLYDCLELESVILPDNLTEIYDSMFRGCESLTVIDIPDGVTKLGDFAFDGCASLASIIIPSGVTYIGNYCFSDCSNLRHIVSWPVITPNLGGNFRYNFLGVAKGGVLAVPAAAKTGSNYSYWVSSGINLGSYGWTLVYMDE